MAEDFDKIYRNVMDMLKRFYGVDASREIGGFNQFGIPKRDEFLLRGIIMFDREPIYTGDRVRYIGEDPHLSGREGVVVNTYNDGLLAYWIETGAVIRTIRIIDEEEEIIGERKEQFNVSYESLEEKSKLQRLKQHPRNKELEEMLRTVMKWPSINIGSN